MEMNDKVKSMKKQKLIFILYSLAVGGAERRATTIANYLVNHGFEIEILLLDNPKVDFFVDNRIRVVYLSSKFDETKQSNENVEVYYSVNRSISIWNRFRLKLLRIEDANQFFAFDQLMYLKEKYANKIYSYLKDKQECTVLSWMTYTSISTCYALRKSRHRIIIVECTSPETEFPENHYMNTLKRKYYPRAQKIICQTDEVASFYNCFREVKKVVIPNPIIGKYPLRYEGTRKKAIVNFCRLSAEKNIPLLIDAFCLLHKDYPDYQLHIFGDGREKDTLKSYALKTKCSNSIQFFDFDINLHEKIVDYSMFVSSSNREGMSNSMLEAMAIGLPTICTDCSGGAARMLINSYENGIVVPKNDISSLYQAMKYIVEHPEVADEMSKKATLIRKKLSLEWIGSQWIKAVMD